MFRSEDEHADIRAAPVKVLLVVRIRQEIGGGHMVVARLANYFDGHAETEVVPYLFVNNHAGFVDRFVNPSIRWYSFDIPTSILLADRRASQWRKILRAFLGTVCFLPSLTLQVRRMCKDNSIKLMHIHAVTTLILLAVPARLTGCKIIFHLHDAFLTEANGGVFSSLTQRILWLTMRCFADRIVTVSEFVRQTVVEYDNSLADKTCVVLNGIDLQGIRQETIHNYNGESIPLVVSYGVVAARKGFQVGIEAVSILKREYGVRVRYQIIGDGPFRADLIRLAQELQVTDQVEFIGFQENVHHFVADADIVLIPPTYEDPFPLVVLEAMANSKIIIASRSGGIPEMIRDGVEGFLVLRNAPEQIAERILDVIHDPLYAKGMGDRAYRRVQQEFSIDSMARRLVCIYRSVLSGNKYQRM